MPNFFISINNCSPYGNVSFNLLPSPLHTQGSSTSSLNTSKVFQCNFRETLGVIGSRRSEFEMYVNGQLLMALCMSERVVTSSGYVSLALSTTL